MFRPACDIGFPPRRCRFFTSVRSDGRPTDSAHGQSRVGRIPRQGGSDQDHGWRSGSDPALKVISQVSRSRPPGRLYWQEQRHG